MYENSICHPALSLRYTSMAFTQKKWICAALFFFSSEGFNFIHHIMGRERIFLLFFIDGHGIDRRNIQGCGGGDVSYLLIAVRWSFPRTFSHGMNRRKKGSSPPKQNKKKRRKKFYRQGTSWIGWNSIPVTAKRKKKINSKEKKSVWYKFYFMEWT